MNNLHTWQKRGENPGGGGRAVLNGEKKCSVAQFSQKSPRAHHVLAVGGWRWAVGDWQLVAVGGGWRPLVVGDW